MSTGGFDNWLGEISEIGAIYPLVGSEGLWVLICLGFWVWWHLAQMRTESLEHNETLQEIDDDEPNEER